VKQQAKAASGPSGVVGDSARGKISRGAWENVFPSMKAVQREREKLHEMTNSHQCFKPIPTLIGEQNRRLKGWANYFSFGRPSSAYCEIERHVQGRLIQHLRRRSQRPYHPPHGEPWLQHLARLGLIRLSGTAHA
jgi:hypothetical protein